MQLHKEEVLHPGLLSFTIKSVILVVLAALYVIMDLFCFDMWACDRSVQLEKTQPETFYLPVNQDHSRRTDPILQKQEAQ